MAATVTLSVFTGASAGTETTGQTGIDLISADNATNSLANRQANPIVAGNNSFEKWLKLRIDVAPDNQITNILVWGDGTVDANTTLYYGTTATGATPVDTASTVATTDFTTATSGAKATWDSGTYTTTGLINNFLVLQLQTTASAAAGNWTQETINYSYDES